MEVLRKLIKLPDLRLVGLVKEGDELHFTYLKKKYAARVTKDGCLVATTPLAQQRRVGPDGVYAMPSNFTLDCVDSYWAANPGSEEGCRTNPSGYERLLHAPSNTTLNGLRDVYIERFLTPPLQPVPAMEKAADVPTGRTPAQLSALASTRTVRPSSGQKRVRRPDSRTWRGRETSSAKPAEASIRRYGILTPEIAGSEAARLLQREPTTVATTKAETNVHGYKAIAEHLELVNEQHNRILAFYHRLVDDMVHRPSEETLATALAVIKAFATDVPSTSHFHQNAADDQDESSSGEASEDPTLPSLLARSVAPRM